MLQCWSSGLRHTSILMLTISSKWYSMNVISWNTFPWNSVQPTIQCATITYLQERRYKLLKRLKRARALYLYWSKVSITHNIILQGGPLSLTLKRRQFFVYYKNIGNFLILPLVPPSFARDWLKLFFRQFAFVLYKNPSRTLIQIWHNSIFFIFIQ